MENKKIDIEGIDWGVLLPILLPLLKELLELLEKYLKPHTEK